MQQVFFHYILPFRLKETKKLKSFIAQIFQTEKKALSRLDYIFCNDEYLLGINQNFLNHNHYTDIITFELADKKKPTTGEVYISIERVKENTANYGSTFKEELLRVIFHGALHLCGYKDKHKNDTKLMREKEQFYISKYLSF